ncbi:MAG TPA: hypothetical protein VGE13_03195 [Candidatus Saccharimonadales bacterium]
MVNPNTQHALDIADGLDEAHTRAAIINGTETATHMQELIEEARERRLAAQSFAAILQSSESAA